MVLSRTVGQAKRTVRPAELDLNAPPLTRATAREVPPVTDAARRCSNRLLDQPLPPPLVETTICAGGRRLSGQ